MNLRDAYLEACRLELEAIKPGNVSLRAAGHGMRAEDFLASAEASAVALTRPDLALGERIFGAIEATHRAVGCNTNLGIVLLCAPLAQAALARGDGESLRGALRRVLRHTTVADAAETYRAIRLANPGGLGRSAQHDVAEAPAVTLTQAMIEAAPRDRIALQYGTGFETVFEVALPRLSECREVMGDHPLAIAATFLHLLANHPDSHIARKFGESAAAEISRRAASVLEEIESALSPDAVRQRLLEADGEFKQDRVNPGTTADLVVAALFAERLLDDGAAKKSRFHRSTKQAMRPAVSQQRHPLEVFHGQN